MKSYKCEDYIRITKTTAKRLLSQGYTIYMILCNMRPNNMWESPFDMNLERYSLGDFEHIVSSYMRSHREYPVAYGRYPAFYIRKDN